ncbi:hypothetical protein [Pseudonocardia asaccharolytica]|uniref:N,N-dimethylformamidase alpha subunit domain-containing protein n=1 Tax=Pseudonocardia asaccharolytica DSM 44247 = NBRC 16224 TaxID=1123024 RepID=A0A511CZV6_9PSEU|nr:hypothetical protein [Pseudonocardia asaccharolytica]GEL18079.1 hypothetical protein PA7_19160 [Pseudonocardia asaccharolytica DSM 44247 = NBRC 16224]
MARLPSLEEQNARAHAAYRQVEKHIFETEIAPRVTAEIIEEHRATPIGKHSDDLERVLTYLRKNQLVMKGKYILVCTRPHEEWRIAEITGEPDQPPTLLDDTFTDRFEAEHAIFRKRLRDNGLTGGEEASA